ncbi:MAG: hypothetical protein KL801_12590 [Mesorhizobium sp.]|nr:hypothetical protein [Mesorhizobium sp.]
MTRDEAIEVRKLIYEDHQKSKRHAFQLNADYGRWLIASLLLVHGAAVAFLAQNERLATTVLPSIFWWHVAGLLLAFLCGFLVWANWSFHARLYEDAVTPRMIYDDEHWPKFDDGTNSWINRTHFTGIIAGILSALCILGSAVQAYCLMSASTV